MSKSFTRQSLMVAVAATSLLSAGYAFAADQTTSDTNTTAASPMSAQEKAVDKDAGKLSMEGAKGYQDVALARLAIFDGRTADAKKFVDAADTAFGKAKTDRTDFVKAENALMSSNDQSRDSAATKPGTSNANQSSQPNAASNAQSSNGQAVNSQAQNGQAANGAQNADTATPKAWLPVDGEISVNEDFSQNPAKAAAVADANKSLAKGDRQGAMAKLKLAQVDLDYVAAVVPLNQTINDVHQAATLVDSGKFYEASQQLRQVQDSTRYDSIDLVGMPVGAKGDSPANGGPSTAQPMTGASKPAANH